MLVVGAVEVEDGGPEPGNVGSLAQGAQAAIFYIAVFNQASSRPRKREPRASCRLITSTGGTD
jgi:hypothetical protein